MMGEKELEEGIHAILDEWLRIQPKIVRKWINDNKR
jgi:hypothetical protein